MPMFGQQQDAADVRPYLLFAGCYRRDLNYNMRVAYYKGDWTSLPTSTNCTVKETETYGLDIRPITKKAESIRPLDSMFLNAREGQYEFQPHSNDVAVSLV